MKYIDEFRDGDGARHIAANIAAEFDADGRSLADTAAPGGLIQVGRFGVIGNYLDGAGFFRIFWRIVLPLSPPIL